MGQKSAICLVAVGGQIVSVIYSKINLMTDRNLLSSFVEHCVTWDDNPSIVAILSDHPTSFLGAVPMF